MALVDRRGRQEWVMADTGKLDLAATTDTPLWRFALALWQQEAARELCLGLQQQGWSVTRLLCAGWLGHNGMPYNGREPAAVMEWRHNVTESIRSLKKSLSKSDSLLTTLREALARAELEAERVELYRAWQAISTVAPAEHPATEVTALLEHNLRRAAPASHAGSNEMTEPMIQQLAQLMTATGPVHRPREPRA